MTAHRIAIGINSTLVACSALSVRLQCALAAARKTRLEIRQLRVVHRISSKNDDDVAMVGCGQGNSVHDAERSFGWSGICR
jgi:hypothetical protein